VRACVLGRGERDPTCCSQGKGRKNLSGAFAQLAAAAVMYTAFQNGSFFTACVMGRVRDIAVAGGAAGEERKINNRLRMYLSSEQYWLA